jgi:hypothetical protein
MSQRQKQRTNENRARRLGSGDGIARHGRKPVGKAGGPGGMPAWAWVVGGAILVAAIAVVAALLVTRGGSSSSGNQTATVITQRNSTAKVDWVSQGTWQPNYTNLQAALTAMNMPTANSTTGYATHYHAHITIYADGHKAPVPALIGIDEADQLLSPIHTHDDSGVIHMEADEKNFTPNLQEVFNVWGLRFNSQCIGGYCGGVKMWVDGQASTQFGAHVMKEHDAITILQGTPPPGFKPDKSFNFPAGE